MKIISLEVVREKMLHHIHQVIPFISVVEFGILFLMDSVCSDGICLLVCPIAGNPLCD
jgi:hypothetical protein